MCWMQAQIHKLKYARNQEKVYDDRQVYVYVVI